MWRARVAGDLKRERSEEEIAKIERIVFTGVQRKRRAK